MILSMISIYEISEFILNSYAQLMEGPVDESDLMLQIDGKAAQIVCKS